MIDVANNAVNETVTPWTPNEFEVECRTVIEHGMKTRDWHQAEQVVANVFRALAIRCLDVEDIHAVAFVIFPVIDQEAMKLRLNEALTRLVRGKVLRSRMSNGRRVYEVNVGPDDNPYLHVVKQAKPAKAKRAPRIEVEFDDIEYRASHCRSPRGTGGWAFALTRNATMEEITWVPGPKTFAEAKRWMTQKLRNDATEAGAEDGTYVHVYVMS